jgi:23S rRNA pseudouridine2605 synthase
MPRRGSSSHGGSRSQAPSKSRRPRSGSGPRPLSPAAIERKESASANEAGQQPENRTTSREAEPAKLERLQKVLARAGLGSRRGCEELILQGRVAVDGQVVSQLGTRVDRARARITVDGEPIHPEKIVYYAVNKPTGYVSTGFDPAGRPRVIDLLPEVPERIYTVGRLDEDSTGLIILTNDGEVANRLAHPRYGVEKLYRALVAGLPSRETVAKLTEGLWLSDGKVRAKRARIVGRQGQATVLELVLAEGKKREIRRMLSKLGHKVMSLNRLAVGPISLKGLATGEYRPLLRHEVELLRKVAAGLSVSLPRFFEADLPSAPGRDAHRRRRSPEQSHGPRSDRGPRQQRRADHRRPPRADSTQHRPPRPQVPTAGPRRVDSPSTPPGQATGAKLPPKSQLGTTPPVKPRRAAASAALPAAPEPVRRRIIGLEQKRVVGTEPGSTGSRGRKRFPPRKRRPPPVPRRKPTAPAEPRSRGDEDA